MPRGPFGYPRLTNLGPFVNEDKIIEIAENKLGEVSEVRQSSHFESKNNYTTDVALDLPHKRGLPSTVTYKEGGDVTHLVLRLPVFRTQEEELVDRLEEVIDSSDPPMEVVVKAPVRGKHRAAHVMNRDMSEDMDKVVSWIERFTRMFEDEYSENELIEETEMEY